MINKKNLGIAAGAVLVLIGAIAFFAVSGNNKGLVASSVNMSTAEMRKEALTIPDCQAQDVQGNMISLTQFTGKPMVINFWGASNPFSQTELPGFEDTYTSQTGDQVEFVMINLTSTKGESIDAAQDYITQNGFTFPVYFDVNKSVEKAFGIRSAPTTVFVDKQGTIVGVVEGALSEESLLRGISLITQ